VESIPKAVRIRIHDDRGRLLVNDDRDWLLIDDGLNWFLVGLNWFLVGLNWLLIDDGLGRFPVNDCPRRRHIAGLNYRRLSVGLRSSNEGIILKTDASVAFRRELLVVLVVLRRHFHRFLVRRSRSFMAGSVI